MLDHVSVDIYEDDFTVIIMGPSGQENQLCCMYLSGMDRVLLPGLHWFYKEGD